MQVNAGLNFIAGVPNTVNYQVLLIALITAAATTSVVLGLVKGISRLSKFNIWMSLIFLLFVFISGPTGILVENLLGSVTDYLIHLPALGVWSETGVTVEWRSSWTTFYWAWWIAWSPFVGMFIARVSKGRTLREFVIGVLLAPCLATFVWLGVFGGTALHLETAQNIPVAKAVSENVSTALFFTLNQLPLATVSASLAVVVIITFFVTSSDSGSLVIDIITAGGAQNPPVNQRVFWAVTEGVAAMTLLMAGGLKAPQAAAIATGLPFSLVLLAMCVSLIKALNNDPYLDKTEN